MSTPPRIWLTTVALYADRLAAFVLPLLVLKALGRDDAYAAIEYVISLSIILATFFDAGLRSYVLYSYRLTGSVQDTTERTLQAYGPIFLLHLLAVALSGLICWLAVSATIEPNLVALGILRACALSIIGLSTQLLILHGRPALAPLLSLLHWIVSGAAFLLPVDTSVLNFVMVFFAASLGMMAAVAFAVFVRRRVWPSVQGIKHLYAAFAWGWPILLAAASSMLVANFSKLYAYSSLPKQDAVAFMFWLRIFSIVQLSHIALVTVLSLEIYRANVLGLLRDNLQRYTTYMLTTTVLVVALGVTSLTVDFGLPHIAWHAIVAMGVYVLMWCFGAYVEIYLSRDAKNVQVLIASVVASLAYTAGLLISQPRSTTHLSLLMCLSASVYLAMLGRVLWRGK